MKLGVYAENGVLTNDLVWHIILLKVRNNGSLCFIGNLTDDGKILECPQYMKGGLIYLGIEDIDLHINDDDQKFMNQFLI